MLPMLLSFLGAGLAKTGALGAFLGANPLMAASIGAGLGRTAETGDLGEGIKAGFGSFLGGTALGAVGNALGGGGAMATPLPNQSAVPFAEMRGSNPWQSQCQRQTGRTACPERRCPSPYCMEAEQAA